MLKHLSVKGKTCLLETANLSWQSGEVPSPWRVADIRPILKSGKLAQLYWKTGRTPHPGPSGVPAGVTESAPRIHSLIQRLSQGPARQTEPTFCSIWAVLSAIGALNEFNVQWMHTWA